MIEIEKDTILCDAEEDEDDEYAEDRSGCNSRKTLLGLFVKEIITDYSNRIIPITQEKILVKLDEYPYCLDVDRKTLSRTINALVDEFPYFYKCDRGVWYDPEHRAA